MTYQEELIFGLVRWLIKGTKYLEKYDEANDLIDDDLTFDALSYVILMVNDITKRILNEPEILEKYSMAEFEEISKIKDAVFVGDGVDFETMFEEVKDNFPIYISQLVANK